jgi:hypothetical protein
VRRWQLANPERLSSYRREYRRRPNRQRADRAYHLLRTYGITLADYDAMLEAQHGVCTICAKPRPEADYLDRDDELAALAQVRGVALAR